MILLWFTCNCSFRGRYDELRKILATSCMLMLSKSLMHILSVSPTKGKKFLLIKTMQEYAKYMHRQGRYWLL